MIWTGTQWSITRIALTRRDHKSVLCLFVIVFLLSISYVEPVKFLKQTSPENVLKTRQKLQNELYFWICVLSDVSGILEEKYDLHLNLFPNVISL